MENEFYGFIYITTNLINGKQYIGMHNNFNDDYLGSGTLLNKAIRKYGRENFSREIITYAKTKKELGELEREFIKKYDAVNSDGFYNIHEGGYGGHTTAGYNKEQLKQYKLKMSKILSGKNHPLYGTKLTENTRNKIRNSHLNYWKNISDEKREEFKTIMSNAVKGKNNPNYAKPWSKEKKQRVRELKIKNGTNKSGMLGKKDENAVYGKQIYLYDKNYNLIKTFKTVKLALNFLDLGSHHTLNRYIKNKTLYKGYYLTKELI